MKLSALKPRFSIRTMLVAMALLALCLWHHMNWIQQRRELIEVGELYVIEDSLVVAPFPLGLFGESGYRDIYGMVATDDQVPAFQAQIEALFPEADVAVDVMCPPESFSDGDEVLP